MSDFYIDINGNVTKNTDSKKKKKKKQTDFYIDINGNVTRTGTADDDIAPVKDTEKRTWFEKGAFEDGYQFGDIFKTAMGTVRDVEQNLTAGILGIGEAVVDAGAYLVGGAGKLFGADEFADKTKKFIADDLIDEKKAARVIIGANLKNPLYVLDPLNLDDSSVLGDKTDSVVQSGGQLIGTLGLQAVGVPWWLTTGVTSFGKETEQAFNEGASYGEAGVSGLISAGAEILTEKISGGIKFGGSTLDDGLTKALATKISDKFTRTALKLGMDVVGEGAEEVLSEDISRFGQWLTYQDDKTLTEMLWSEEAMNEKIEAFIGGAMLGGAGSGINVARSSAVGRDATTGLTSNEETVFKHVYESRVAEAEKNGEISKKEKNKIYDEVMDDLQKGEISIEDIEEALGGDSYKAYKDTIDKEDAAIEEIKSLYNDTTIKNEFNSRVAEAEANGKTLTSKEKSKLYKEIVAEKRAEFEEAVKGIRTNPERITLKQKLGKEVFDLAKQGKDAYLLESFDDAARRGQDFQADLNEYKNDYAKQTVKNIMEAKSMNNTRASHQMVNFMAKMSADKGVVLSVTDAKKLAQTGLGINGKTINGYKTDDGIVVNLSSEKSLNFIVGHEISHVLENTEFYQPLQEAIFEYAKKRKSSEGKFENEYAERLYNARQLYKDVKGYEGVQGHEKIKNEVVSDLVGDYLFTDPDFVKHLSTEHRNVFQKIYDEVKYLLKVVTAGSKEEKELLKVKKAFEDAYRADSKTTAKAEDISESPTQYSVSVADEKTIEFLENQEHITTYKAMQLIDGKLYPPMAAKVKGEDGKYRLNNPSELGKWQQATEDPTNIKKVKNGVGYYTLNKGNGKSIDAAYNPYEHSSNLVLNDQFEEAYNRDNIVTVECEIPVSEMSSGYKAEYAKDGTGVMDWKSGVVAGKIKDNKRKVYLSRWLKPVRILSDAETAAMYKEVVGDVSVPFNVVTPGLLTELEKAGVNIDYEGSPMYKSIQSRKTAKSEIRYSLSETTDGRFVAVVDNDILSNIDTSSWDKTKKDEAKKAASEALKKFKDGIVVDGITRKVNKKSRDEYTRSEYTESLYNHAPDVFADKMRAADVADDIVVATTNWNRDGGLTHPRDDNFVDFDHGTTLIMSGNAKYSAEVIVGITNKGEAVFYDVVDMIPTTFDIKKEESSTAATTQDAIGDIQEDASAKSISQKDSDVNTQFSLSSDTNGRQLSEGQKEYFKDSKVVDENGNLKVMYHTTNNDFTVFDKSKMGEATGDTNTYLGFFFADDAEYMQNFPEFENGKTEAYYLNMKNPIDMTNISKEAFLDVVEVLGGDVTEAAEIYDQELSDEMDRAQLRGDNNTSLQLIRLLDEMTGDADYRAFIEELKPHYNELMSKGYDGVVNYLDELWGAKEYIVLDSNQAKLTSNTKPTADADIRYSLSDSKQGDNDVKVMDGGSVTKYSLSTWTPETQTKVRENLIKSGYDADKVDKWIKDTNSVASVIAADKDRLDFVAADNQVMLKDNQDYIKTLDASTLCAKRLVYQGTFDAIQHRMPNTALSSDDLIDLLNMMKEHGVQTPCGVCYVESRRRHLGKFAQGWLDSYEGEYKPNLDEVTTSDGLEALRKSHPQTYKDFVDAMNKKGSSNPKVVQLRTEYRNEIMSLTPKQISDIEAIGGLRVQSFSDFETPHMLDMMQAVMDMSAKGLHSQAYTKVPNFAWVFGDTGIKINLSLIAEGDGFDADGNLAFSSTEGMDINEAMRLRDAYSQNVGTIIVGANDKHILAAMADDRIDFIIPFHRSGWGMKELEMMGMSSYTDYTYGQKEHDLNKPTKVVNGVQQYAGLENLYPPDYWNYALNGKENAERYLNLCAKTGREPKFSKFLVNNGDGSYSLQPDGSTDGYWKTLIDFKMYDNAGNGAAQQKVLPNFNMDEAYRVLGEYEGGANKLPVANDVVEEFVAKYQSKELAPTMSLSAEGETPKSYGRFNIYGKDVMLEEDIAPIGEGVAENATTTEDIAPMPDEIDETISEWKNLSNRQYEAIRPKQTKEPKMARVTDNEGAKTTERLIKRSELHRNKMDGIKAKFAEKGLDLDEVLKKAKDLSTFSTVDNTPQRVMEKSLGYKEGQILADETVNKVAQNETEGIKWLNSFTDRKSGMLKKISDRYNIKPGSKESAAAQMYAEGFYVDDNNNLIKYGDAELAKDFPDARVQNNIKALARDPRIRRIYDDTLKAINESRVRNGYPEIQRLDNYFLHFRAMNDTFSRLGLPFNPNDIRAKDLPTDLNGVTADLKPGQPYFASAMHRRGQRTSFDLLGGLERYLSSAKNQIYHIDDIQTLRALRNYIADTYGQANGLEGLDALSEEEAQERIKDVYNSHLSTFAKFLNEEANILAGKTALIDRGLEGIIGRRAMTFMDTINRQVGSNMVGYNISSALTNLIAPVQAFAKMNKTAFIKGFAQTVSNRVKSISGKGDGFADASPVMIRRKGADRFHRTAWQKISDPGYALMGAVDNFSTELIARAKYNELTAKGMASDKAHLEADKWVSRLMGDRSLGQMPQLYNSKTLGLITKFQLEVRNQLDSQFYDTIKEAEVSTEDIQNGRERNAKKAAKIASTFFTLAVSQHLFGKVFESIAGYNPAFDIISVLIKTLGLDDDEESEDTALDNIEQGFFELMGDMPYTSILEGGRIPIASALPIEELYKGVDQYGNEKSRFETIKEALPYYLMPGGYGQAKKTIQGLSMFDEDHPIAGSYTDSGNLRFPVEDTLGNRIQAGIFGQYASENARDYFDNDYAPLKEKQIQEFVDLDIPIGDYRKIREDLAKLDTLGEKAVYIAGLDLPMADKNLLINNIADREEPIDLTGLVEYGDFGEFEYAKKYPNKYEFLKENNISYEEYQSFDEDTKEAWSWAYQNPGKFTLSKAIASDVVVYKQYTKALNSLKADKDENGDSISGSRKEKVIEYINDLDAEYGEKIVLFKSAYKADNTYNYEIIDYLNGRDDLSYEDVEAILKELGFDVDSEGNITW